MACFARPLVAWWMLAIAAVGLSGRTILADEPGKGPLLRAGAAEVEITPVKFPVIVSGMFDERTANSAADRLMARALVLDDGQTRLAIVVVDNLMLPRSLLDEAKELAKKATGIPTERMLISATHTHSAPSAMGCLGSRADVEYQRFLTPLLARSIALAAERLSPARIGWTVLTDEEHNHCRRWIFRADRMQTDPFGVRNVRAHMHPGYLSANHIGPSGPADTDLSVLAVQTPAGKPIAVLANYAMHYFGSPLVSGDVCGRFGPRLASLLGADKSDPPLVGMLSQGTSGDSMWMDYSRPPKQIDLDGYTAQMATIVRDAYQKIEFRDNVRLAMAETKLKLHRRVPDEARLAAAREKVAALEGKLPRAIPDVYAHEQVYLHDDPEAELKLQAIRIGDLGITAIPDEVYGITGWKLKARSPLATTFNIELANGAEGYIPPPEQHALGGYTTWPARTAGLEVQAEPKIVAALTELLEKVAEKPRKTLVDGASDYSRAVAAAKPQAYWRLGEIDGTEAADAIGKHAASYEPGVAFYLPGPAAPGLDAGVRGNRAAHFAGGRVKATVAPGKAYSVELWLWNGLPNDARAVTGYFFSRGPDAVKNCPGDHLGIGGTYKPEWAGRLLLFNGNERDEALVGRTVLAIKTWQHVVLTRDGGKVAVYLNGNKQPEFAGELAATIPADCRDLFLGGRSDGLFGLEGKLDEVALFDRALSADEVAAHFAAARYVPSAPAAAPPADAPKAALESPPRSPAESLAMIHVPAGYEVELVAAEPLVVDPVAIEWGPDGRLWVVEMADYPEGLDGRGKPGGRVRFLEDTNGDGRYDKSTLFLEGLNFPTGILPWRRGVLITAAPDILYAEDTDGDGRADRREVLFSGFLEGNQQLRVNGLRYGLDGWVYCASGAHYSGYGAQNKIRSQRTGAEIVIGSRDFRIDPDQARIDPLSGPSQFGRNRDDWGNWFGVQNSHPLWHYVLEDRYTRRNPHVASPDPKRQLFPANPPVFAAKPPEKRFHSFEQSGRFTSACSGMIYRDELLFREGLHAFTCEPFHNLVQHHVLAADGVSFRASRDPAEKELDFFASEDRWCRPVMASTGPDGALWIVDMYRYMIEHPEWLPPNGKEELRPFYRAGDDRGRIYRVFPKGQRPRTVPRLDAKEPESLLAALDSPNGWQRDTAQRLLVEAGGEAAVPALVKMASSAERPQARLHALATLAGLGKLPAEALVRALGDAHPGVRRFALELAEPRGEKQPELVTAAARLVRDPDPKVRLQLACSLGEWSDAEASAALAIVAVEGANDEILSAAVLSSLSAKSLPSVLEAVLRRTAEEPTAARSKLVDSLLSVAVKMESRQALGRAVSELLAAHMKRPSPWQFAAAGAVADALARGNKPRDAYFDKESGAAWQELQRKAREAVADDKVDPALRAAATELLGRDEPERAADLGRLRELLVPQSPAEVQSAVVARLASEAEPQVAGWLLAGWRGHSPALRSQILAVVASRPAWVEVLVGKLESRDVLPAEIDAPLRQRLAATKDAALRSRLEKLFALASTADRQQALAAFQPALQLTGDRARGAVVHQKRCATCHRLEEKGFEVGPNLVSLSNKSPAALLTAILDPSSAVDAKYVEYVATTRDGRTFNGILATETGANLVLLAAEGKRQVILRSELESLSSTGKSLMPDGLEKDLSLQEMADLIEYIAKAGR